MWYFAWLPGPPLAALFAVVNAMWLEMREDDAMAAEPLGGASRHGRR